MNKQEKAENLVKKYGAAKVKAAMSKDNMQTWYSIVNHPAVCRLCKAKIYDGRIEGFNDFCMICQPIINKVLEQ